MFSSDEPVWVNETKKHILLKETLEKMEKAEVIARGLGIGRGEIDRLKAEGLRELSLAMSPHP